MSQTLSLPRRYIARAWHSRFARNVAVVATGTAAAQTITLAFAPLITRLYGPEAFGLLGAFMALVAIVTPIAALSYPIAIVLPKEDREALALAWLSVSLSFTLATAVAGALWIGGDWLVGILGIESIGAYLLLIPFVMLFSAWLQVARQWLIRKKEFDVIAKVVVAHSFLLNCAKSGIGFFHPVAAVLILLATFGQVVQTTLLVLGAVRRHRRSPVAVCATTAKSLRGLAHQYRDFPLYRAPQNLINAASQGVPVLLLAAFFGPMAAGFYTLARIVMGIPSALVGNAVTDVFYPRITEAAHARENLSGPIVQGTVALLMLGALPFGAVIIFGPSLFGFVFGSEWVTAGEYARWLALFFLFNFINRPSVAAVPVLGIQRGLLVYEVLSTGGKIIGLLVGFLWFESDIFAVALFSVIGVIAYSAMILWIVSHALIWDRSAQAG